ncbi:MAG: SDR family NAD(P)-dependent oxidoreductase [Spirochaetales bacterium]|nr:SDR family NAD(P)-dependent oxidoreductase [Spirochaetales bacterium]
MAGTAGGPLASSPRLSGSVVLVTGSSRGIGRELARLAAVRGARVVINGRNPDTVAQVCTSFAAGGLEATGIAADVSDPAGGRRLVEQALEQLGRIDLLINNAGLAMRAPLAAAKPEAAWRIVQTNLGGALFPTMAALQLARDSLRSISFVSSLAGLHGIPGAACYCTTKAALTALAESLQGELHGTGIHVGVYYLGFTQNDPEKRFVAPDGGLEPVKHTYRWRRTQRQSAAWILRNIEKRRFKAVQTLPGKLLRPLALLAPCIVRGLYRRGIDQLR